MTRKIYRSENMDVSFDPVRCIHAKECVNNLPEVFDLEKRPWVQPGGSEPDRVAETVQLCPTGALRFEREDGGAQEGAPDKNSISVSESGPLYVRGDIEIRDPTGRTIEKSTRVALCRCGESKNKPFCDNSHRRAGFRDAGALGENRLRSEPVETGSLGIVPTVNGPFLLKGGIEVRSADGETVYRGTRAALCRCGHSGNKPFCDGTHADIMWQDDQ